MRSITELSAITRFVYRNARFIVKFHQITRIPGEGGEASATWLTKI